jgi:hypothetical protein
MCEWPLRLWSLGSHPLECPQHHGSSDAEEFGKLGLGVVPCIVQLQQVLRLVWLQFRMLTPADPWPWQLSFLPGCAVGSGRIRTPATMASTLNSSRLTGRSDYELSRRAELAIPFDQLVQDVAGIGQRPGEAVYLVTTKVSPPGSRPRLAADRVGRGWRRLGRDRRRCDHRRHRARAVRSCAVRSCCSVDTRAYPARSSFIHLHDAARLRPSSSPKRRPASGSAYGRRRTFGPSC